MRKLSFLLPFLLSAIILFVLFKRFDFAGVMALVLVSNKTMLFLSVLLLFFIYPLAAARWIVALRALGCEVMLWEAIKFYLANLPIAKITPTYAGDFLRAFYFKDKMAISKGAGIVFAEAFFDICSLAIFALIGGFLLDVRLSVIVGLFMLIATFFVLFFIHKFKPKILKGLREKVDNFLHIFSLLLRSRNLFLLVGGLTLLKVFVVLSYIKMSFFVFGARVPLSAVMALYPVVSFITILPITFSGIGARESSMVILFSAFAPAQKILAVALFYSFVGAVVVPLICIPFLIQTFNRQKFFYFRPRKPRTPVRG